MVNLPVGHPARILDDTDEARDDHSRLLVSASGGQREPDTKTLRHWQVTAELQNDYYDTRPNVEVARMSAITVQPYLGNPWEDLDHIDGDAEALGAVLFEDSERSAPFMDIAEGFDSVVLIDTYTVEPSWRGTPYSAFIAARMLNLLADMGPTAAALHASPTGFDGPEAERRRVRKHIKRMWASLGFEALEGAPDFMAKALDPYDAIDLVNRLAAEHAMPWTAREI